MNCDICKKFIDVNHTIIGFEGHIYCEECVEKDPVLSQKRKQYKMKRLKRSLSI